MSDIDDIAMEEGRLEQIRAFTNYADLVEPHVVRELIAELDRLRGAELEEKDFTEIAERIDGRGLMSASFSRDDAILLDAYRHLRAENDALKQQLQALRKANPNG